MIQLHKKLNGLWNFFQNVFLISSTEFAVEICEAVKNAWEPTIENPIISNPVNIAGQGNRPISAFIDAIFNKFGTLFEVVNYSEHLLGSGSQGKAATYIELSYFNQNGDRVSK